MSSQWHAVLVESNIVTALTRCCRSGLEHAQTSIQSAPTTALISPYQPVKEKENWSWANKIIRRHLIRFDHQLAVSVSLRCETRANFTSQCGSLLCIHNKCLPWQSFPVALVPAVNVWPDGLCFLQVSRSQGWILSSGLPRSEQTRN